MIQTICFFGLCAIAAWGVADQRGFVVGLCIGGAWVLGVSYGR